MNRKITAILKLGLGLTPAIIAIGGACSFVGLGVTAMIKETKAVNLFTETEQFAVLRDEKIDELEERYEEGKLTDKEYKDRKDYLNSSDYAAAIMKSSYPDNEDINQLNKEVKDINSKIYYTFIPFGGGMVASFITYSSDKFNKLLKVSKNMKEAPDVEEKKKKRQEEKMQKERERQEKMYSEEIVE